MVERDYAIEARGTLMDSADDGVEIRGVRPIAWTTEIWQDESDPDYLAVLVSDLKAMFSEMLAQQFPQLRVVIDNNDAGPAGSQHGRTS
jgi:hypothetical protein